MKTNIDKIPAMSFMVLIAGRKEKDRLLSALSEQGAHIINTLYGKGSGGEGLSMRILGLITENAKVVITCIVSENSLDGMLKMLTEQFKFNEKNTGIAFTIPVENLSY